jgi:hypothetical protein
MIPFELNGVGVISLSDKGNGVINGTVRLTLSVEILVRSPAVIDNRSAWFDPSVYNGHQVVGGSVRYWNKKCFVRLTFDSAEHPVALNRFSAIVSSPTEHAVVDLDGLVRTANLFRAALQIHWPGLSAEHAPVCVRFGTEDIFLLD